MPICFPRLFLGGSAQRNSSSSALPTIFCHDVKSWKLQLEGPPRLCRLRIANPSDQGNTGEGERTTRKASTQAQCAGISAFHRVITGMLPARMSDGGGGRTTGTRNGARRVALTLLHYRSTTCRRKRCQQYGALLSSERRISG